MNIIKQFYNEFKKRIFAIYGNNYLDSNIAIKNQNNDKK